MSELGQSSRIQGIRGVRGCATIVGCPRSGRPTMEWTENTPREMRVMVVDDHEVVRCGVSALVDREPDMEVVAVVSSGEEALAILDETRPDVVLMDHRLPGMHGIEACRRILRRRPSTSVVILTSFMTDDVIHQSLVAGARGFLTKDIDTADIPRATRVVANGDAVLSPSVTARVIDWARGAKALEQGHSLSSRELELLSLVSEGFSNRALAEHLGIRETTVKSALRSAMRKLGVTRRWEAVAVAMERGAI